MNKLKPIADRIQELHFSLRITPRMPNPSFNPDVASVSHFSHEYSGILVSSHRAPSATPVNSPRWMRR